MKKKLVTMLLIAAMAVTTLAGCGDKGASSTASNTAETKGSADAGKEDAGKDLMGIHTLGGGLYSYWPVDYSKPVDKEGDLERSIQNMRKVAKIAEEYDITMGMECLNRFEGYLLNTCEEAIAYVDAVGSSHVKVMLDTFHMNIEENNIAAAIRKAGDKLGHFHIGERNRQVPGRGTMPWAEIGQALRDINYQGAVVMEPFVMPGGTVGSNIKVWRDIVPDTSEEALDRDVAKSLQLVKFIFGA